MKYCLVVIFALLCACGVETIVAGKTGSNGENDANTSKDGAVPPLEAGAGASCSHNADCEINEFCAKTSCEAPQGTCEIRPSVCTDVAAPVCGCDGVTYFNDCLRQTTGIAASKDRQCSFDAKRCGSPRRDVCEAGQYCALLVPEGAFPCPPDAPGTCWVLPSVCGDLSGGGNRFNSCQGPPLSCMDACTAIRSEQPHRFASGGCPRPPP